MGRHAQLRRTTQGPYWTRCRGTGQDNEQAHLRASEGSKWLPKNCRHHAHLNQRCTSICGSTQHPPTPLPPDMAGQAVPCQRALCPAKSEMSWSAQAESVGGGSGSRGPGSNRPCVRAPEMIRRSLASAVLLLWTLWLPSMGHALSRCLGEPEDLESTCLECPRIQPS